MKKLVDKAVATVLVVVFVGMLVNVTWQVVSRKLDIANSISEELARYLLIWLGILGAAYVAGQKLHLAIDLLSHKLGPKWGEIHSKLLHSLALAFAGAVLLIGGGNVMLTSWNLEQMAPALSDIFGRFPVAIVYAIMPFSGLLMVYYAAYFFTHKRDEA